MGVESGWQRGARFSTGDPNAWDEVGADAGGPERGWEAGDPGSDADGAGVCVAYVGSL
jgi:hypothetical protein